VPVVAWLLGVLLVLPLGLLVRRITARTPVSSDDALVARLRRPARLVAGAMVAAPLLRAIGLPAQWQRWTGGLTSGIVVLGVLWMLLRASKLLEDGLATSAWGSTPQARSLIPLLGRIVRAFVALLALLVTLSLLGYPVSTLLAGLGIGGIAIALAAQKTIENLFGSLSLAADRAFRVGDWVTVDGVSGTVELIGLRSTALRTSARSLVRIPNGRLAEMRIENFGMRDRWLLETRLGLTYDTSMPQLQRIARAIEVAIRAHPGTWPDTVMVRFSGFGESALELHVMAWLLAADVAQFREWQEALLAECHGIVVREGAAFAFPSRTVHVVADGAATPALAVTSTSVRAEPGDAKARSATPAS
jgi:MscS family membrane protein